MACREAGEAAGKSYTGEIFMSVNGLWTSEIYGLHGWENTGVVVLDNGRTMGGGRNHYSVGTYRLSENEIDISLVITYHGSPRTLFGSSDSQLSLRFNGQHDDGVIEGSVYREGNPKQTLSFRLTKRADIH